MGCKCSRSPCQSVSPFPGSVLGWCRKPKRREDSRRSVGGNFGGNRSSARGGSRRSWDSAPGRAPPDPQPLNSPRGPSSFPGGIARGVPPRRLLLGGPPRTVRSRRRRGQGALPWGRAWTTSRARPWVAAEVAPGDPPEPPPVVLRVGRTPARGDGRACRLPTRHPATRLLPKVGDASLPFQPPQGSGRIGPDAIVALRSLGWAR